MKFLTTKDLAEMAKDIASLYADAYPYIPQTKSEMKDWEVHSWVVEALDRAYTQGLRDCKTLYEESSQRA